MYRSFYTKLFKLYPSGRGRCLDIEGSDMGDLAVVTNFMHDNIYYLTLQYSYKFGDGNAMF